MDGNTTTDGCMYCDITKDRFSWQTNTDGKLNKIKRYESNNHVIMLK